MEWKRKEEEEALADLLGDLDFDSTEISREVNSYVEEIKEEQVHRHEEEEKDQE